ELVFASDKSEHVPAVFLHVMQIDFNEFEQGLAGMGVSYRARRGKFLLRGRCEAVVETAASMVEVAQQGMLAVAGVGKRCGAVSGHPLFFRSASNVVGAVEAGWVRC